MEETYTGGLKMDYLTEVVENVNSLLNQKKAKNKKLDVLTQEYVHISNNYNTRKNRAWLQTNFKKLGLTNDKQRSAYVEDYCKNLKHNMERKHAEIETIKRHIFYLDQSIELQKIVMELRK